MESAIYVDDLGRARAFYGEVIGLRPMLAADELAQWEHRLTERQIPIEGRVQWPRGGQSIYFRDPDGHLVELATPGLWDNY